MTSHEIVLDNLNHNNPLRPALHFDRGRMSDFIGIGPGLPKGYTQKRRTEGPAEYFDDIWGNIWRRMKDGCNLGEIFKPAIEDWRQLKHLKLPEYDLDACIDVYRSGFAGHEDKFSRAWISGGLPFALSCDIRRMDNYLMDLIMYPQEVRELHRKLAKVVETLIHAAGRAGADSIFFCEDMGTQNGLLISVEMWRDYFEELYGRLFAIAHEYGMKVIMHSCGKNDDIVEPLLKCGVDCLQFDQPAIYDMAALAATLREYRSALYASIDIQKILPTGDRTIIEQGVEDMFEYFEGFIIFKSYPDLPGIGVDEQWDQWAYEKILDLAGIGNY